MEVFAPSTGLEVYPGIFVPVQKANPIVMYNHRVRPPFNRESKPCCKDVLMILLLPGPALGEVDLELRVVSHHYAGHLPFAGPHIALDIP